MSHTSSSKKAWREGGPLDAVNLQVLLHFSPIFSWNFAVQITYDICESNNAQYGDTVFEGHGLRSASAFLGFCAEDFLSVERYDSANDFTLVFADNLES